MWRDAGVWRHEAVLVDAAKCGRHESSWEASPPKLESPLPHIAAENSVRNVDRYYSSNLGEREHLSSRRADHRDAHAAQKLSRA